MSNKSEATWHPSSGPMTDHADLIARHDAGLIKRVGDQLDRDVYHESGFETVVRDLGLLAIRQAAALVALADSVPREQYDLTVLELTRQISNTRDERDEAHAERDALQRGVVAATERAEAAEAERDALAHVIEHVRPLLDENDGDAFDAAYGMLADSSAGPTLARHDAEVKAEALDEAREAISTKPAMLALPERFLAARAAAIRAEAE